MRVCGGEGRAGRGRASGSVNSGPGVGFIFLNPTAPPRPRAASAPPPLEPREHARADALLPVRVPRSDHLLLAVPRSTTCSSPSVDLHLARPHPSQPATRGHKRGGRKGGARSDPRPDDDLSSFVASDAEARGRSVEVRAASWGAAYMGNDLAAIVGVQSSFPPPPTPRLALCPPLGAPHVPGSAGPS